MLLTAIHGSERGASRSGAAGVLSWEAVGTQWRDRAFPPCRTRADYGAAAMGRQRLHCRDAPAAEANRHARMGASSQHYRWSRPKDGSITYGL